MGGKTATSTSQQTIPASVLAQYQAVNSRATATAATPFQQYGGEFVAPVNSQQTTGIGGINQAAGLYAPYYGAATGAINQAQAGTVPANNAALGLTAASAGQVNAQPLDVQRYMSPYLNTVASTEENLLNQQNAQQQSSGLGTAVQSGAFGGDRAGIAAANLQQQNQLANANILGGILNTGYNTGLGTAQQQQGVNLSASQANRAALANAGSQIAGIGQTAYGEGAGTANTLAGLGTGAQQAGLSGAEAQIGAGTLQQQTQQAQDTALYNQFLQQQSYPFQVDQFLANIAEGTGALSGSTTTTQQPGGFFSDERLKEDARVVGKTFDGQPIYSYKMKGDPRTRMGLMAQDVEHDHPDAVGLAHGYKWVDYEKATEDAANRGHFREGGLVPFPPRKMRAAGGGTYDLDSILDAQARMYAPDNKSQRNIPSQQAGVGHTLNAPQPVGTTPHTGAENVNETMGLGEKGYQIYSHFSSPSSVADTPSTDMTYSALDATAPAADSSTVSGLSSTIPAAESAGADAAGSAATGAATGAAADAAGTAAADAAGTAAADEAAVLAAEYAVPEIAAAVAAKRGGRIRKGLAAGGMPYEGDGLGTPYQQTSGTLDIPNQENSIALPKDAPIKKQPTGLQTMMMMGDPNDMSTIAGAAFSNQGLGSKRGGRIKKADGGGLGDDPDEPTTEGPPAPTAQPGLADGVVPSKVSDGQAGIWDTIRNHVNANTVVPLLSGLAAMGTDRTRSFGTALAAGLGAGADSYLQTRAATTKNQLEQQKTEGIALANQLARKKLSYLDAPDSTPYSPTSQLPQQADPNMPLADRLRIQNQVMPYTQQDQADLQVAYKKAIALNSNAPVESVMARIKARREDQAYANQQAMQGEYDRAYRVAKTSKDPQMAASAAAAADAYSQYTGDTIIEPGGVQLNSRTKTPFIGDQAQRLNPGTYSSMMERARERIEVPTGVPGQTKMVPRYESAGFDTPDAYVASLPPAGTPDVPGRQAPASAAPTAVSQPAKKPVTAVSTPANHPHTPTPAASDDPYADPKYVRKNVSGMYTNPGVQETASANYGVDLDKDAESTTQSASTALQMNLAAKQILEAKGAPVTGIYGPVARELSRVFPGGIDASNYQKAAKYLGNAAVQAARQNFPHATEKENMLQFGQLSPSLDMEDPALHDLLDTNIATNKYALDTANRVREYRSHPNLEPLSFFRWNQEHFPRQDAINQKKIPGAYKVIGSKAEYDALNSGDAYEWKGRQGTKQ